MFGLTSLGIFHTIISLVAVVVGAIALIRDGKITWENLLGKIYVITTILVCLTGLWNLSTWRIWKTSYIGCHYSCSTCSRIPVEREK